MSPRRSPGDGTIFRRKSDNLWVAGFELEMKDGSRRQARVTAKTRNEVVRKMRELKETIDSGADPKAGKVKLENWLQHWLENICAPRVRPTTLKSYATTIRLYINPQIGHKRLNKLSMNDVRGMHTALQESSSRNAQKAHQVLQMALKDAKREGLVSRNVAEDVGRPRHTPQEQTAFTAKASKAILATAYAGDEMWATRWAVGFLTGAREGEVLGLTWDRVHFDVNRIDISWQLQELQKTHGCGEQNGFDENRKAVWPCGMKMVSFCPDAKWKFPVGYENKILERNLVLTRPKTRKGQRTVPILPGLAKRLQRLESHVPNPHGLVFHHADGKPFGPSQDQRAWKELLEDAGVAHVKQHTMRHSTASLLLAHGVDPRIIQEILGHTNILTTRGYQHVDLELARTALEPLGELLP